MTRADLVEQLSPEETSALSRAISLARDHGAALFASRVRNLSFALPDDGVIALWPWWRDSGLREFETAVATGVVCHELSHIISGIGVGRANVPAATDLSYELSECAVNAYANEIFPGETQAMLARSAARSLQAGTSFTSSAHTLSYLVRALSSLALLYGDMGAALSAFVALQCESPLARAAGAEIEILLDGASARPLGATEALLRDAEARLLNLDCVLSKEERLCFGGHGFRRGVVGLLGELDASGRATRSAYAAALSAGEGAGGALGMICAAAKKELDAEERLGLDAGARAA